MSELVTSRELSVWMRTKTDIDFILRWDLEAYLCHSKYLTVYHYRDLLTGAKKVRPLLCLSFDFNIFILTCFGKEICKILFKSANKYSF